MAGNEERRAERFKLELSAYLSIMEPDDDSSESTLNLKTSDVSSGGAFFDTDKPLSIGTAVKIDMIVPLEQLKNLKGKNVKIEVSGAVIRINNDGMGICFDEEYTISKIPENETD